MMMLPQTVVSEQRIRVLTETITRLCRRGGGRPLHNVLAKTVPADLAHVLRLVNREDIRPIFLAGPPEIAGETLSYLSPRVIDILIQDVGDEEFAAILEKLAPDELADFISTLPAEVSERLMSRLQAESKEEVEVLLQFDSDSAGGIMTLDFFALQSDLTVEEAINTIHGLSDVEMVFYLYVIDAEGHLKGVVSLRQLVLAKPEAPLDKIMNARVIKVHTDTAQEEVARIAQDYKILAIPVVDMNNVLVGMVTIDDIIDVIQEETTRDMLRMAGTNESEILTRSPFKIARVRLPWLFAAFIGGLLATGVIATFEDVLTKVLALSAFLPVIMGMAGNVGVQTATVAVRGLATGAINVHHLGPVIMKEFGTGVLLGLFYGAILAVYGVVVFGGIELGAIVGATVLTNMIGAAVLAVALPMLFHRVGVDPAIATGPFVTTAIDILGVSNYFLIATLVLEL